MNLYTRKVRLRSTSWRPEIDQSPNKHNDIIVTFSQRIGVCTLLIDARSLPENEKIQTDVCIVGAGLAGITLALEFIDKGFRVCILESGGPKPHPETQSLVWGENVGHPYFSLDTAYSCCLGGSVNRWELSVGNYHLGARMRPLDSIDFEERDWIPYSGWPFEKSHLDPYYDRAQKICKIDPLSFNVRDWEGTGRAQFPVLNGVETTLFKFGLRDPFLDDYITQVARAGNIQLYIYATVVEVETDGTAQNVNFLRVTCPSGKEFTVSANIYILATNGIETPRLLLLSNKTQRTGLGNQHDLVGRFFMEHPHCWSGVFIPSTQDTFRRAGFYSRVHIIDGIAVIGKLVLSDKLIRHEKLLNYVAELVPRVLLYSSLSDNLFPPVPSDSVHSFKVIRSAILGGTLPENLGRNLKHIAKGMDDISLTVYRNIKRKFIRVFNKKKVRIFRLANMSEQAPNPMSRVTLSSEKDRFGRNFARLDWRLSAIDKQSIRRSQEILGKELNRAGLGRLYIELSDETPPQAITGGWHQMGTTRMHRDPRKGVVNEHCRVHGISNLYISGPSVFPTSGYANPALTIVALAVRLADHITSVFS